MGSKFTAAAFGGDTDTWDRFVGSSNGGTLFHRQDFLAYHGDRFRETARPIAFYKGDALHGVMPLAIDSDGVGRSPYGGSYGGPVFRRSPGHAEAMALVAALGDAVASVGAKELVLTLPVPCCDPDHSDTFRLALQEQGATLVERDISSVVRLDDDMESRFDKRVRHSARKALRSGIQIERRASVDDLWKVLEATMDKHGAKATHRHAELAWLHQNLPGAVRSDVAYHEGVPVAGITRFRINAFVESTFYFAQDPVHQDLQGLSLLVHEGLLRARDGGYRWLDFGTSSVGGRGRPNIFRFKEGFGAVGQFRETYRWCL